MRIRTRRTIQVDTKLLNVDFEIASKHDLVPLVTALGTKVLVLWVARHKGLYRAHLEVADPQGRNVRQKILRFAKLLKQLPPSVFRLWKTAKKRDFAIGIVAGLKAPTTDFLLDEDVLKETVRLGARVVICVYPPVSNVAEAVNE